MTSQPPRRAEESAFREGIRARDPAAWKRLAREYTPTLLRHAAALLPPDQDAEDVVGDVWMKAVAGASQYDPAYPPYPWLARICENLCADRRKGRPFLDALARLLRLGERRAPAQRSTLVTAETRAVMREAVETLRGREREILTLRYHFLLPLEEIAQILHIKENSARRTLIRGLERLREQSAEPEYEVWKAFLEEGDVWS